jgi:hypothetical protein
MQKVALGFKASMDHCTPLLMETLLEIIKLNL